VVEHPGAEEGGLLVDETGFLKKGKQAAGVKRPYSGPAGSVDTWQIGVFLAYATASASAFLGRARYLPKEWLEEKERGKSAGIPEQPAVAPKPALARQMIPQAIDERVPFRGVSADRI